MAASFLNTHCHHLSSHSFLLLPNTLAFMILGFPNQTASLGNWPWLLLWWMHTSWDKLHYPPISLEFLFTCYLFVSLMWTSCKKKDNTPSTLSFIPVFLVFRAHLTIWHAICLFVFPYIFSPSYNYKDIFFPQHSIYIGLCSAWNMVSIQYVFLNGMKNILNKNRIYIMLEEQTDGNRIPDEKWC